MHLKLAPGSASSSSVQGKRLVPLPLQGKDTLSTVTGKDSYSLPWWLLADGGELPISLAAQEGDFPEEEGPDEGA